MLFYISIHVHVCVMKKCDVNVKDYFSTILLLLCIGERSAAVIAALESRTEQVPMSSRRYTGGSGMQQLSVSPSPSFDTGSQDSGGNNSRTATPLHNVSNTHVYKSPL